MIIINENDYSFAETRHKGQVLLQHSVDGMPEKGAGQASGVVRILVSEVCE